MPIGYEQVQPAVVVKVEKSRAPPQVRQRDSPEAGLVRGVGKAQVGPNAEAGPHALVAVERVDVIGKVRHEQVEPPVAVKVAAVYPHAGLVFAIAAKGHARFDADLS